MLPGYHVISRYMKRSVLSAVAHNSGRSWNILPADTAVRLYTEIQELT